MKSLEVTYLIQLILTASLMSCAISIQNIKITLSSQHNPSNNLIQYDAETNRIQGINTHNSEDMIFQKIERNLQAKCHDTSNKCFQETKSLDLSSNNLKQFPDLFISRWFAGLTSFNLSNNQLANINSNFKSFKSKLKIQSLDLSHNKLTKIYSNNFASLKSIRKLYLSSNQISNIDAFSFAKNLRHLVELDLSHNVINDNSIEFLLFATLPSLKVLELNNNQLTIIKLIGL